MRASRCHIQSEDSPRYFFRLNPRDWIDLFRLIPSDQHNTLVLTTASGIDLNLDTILRTEPDYVVFRGRVSGITDEGRVFFLPYRQIDFVQINRTVKEVEIRQMYGELTEDGREVSSTDATPESESSQGISPAPTNRAEAPATGGKRQSNPPSPATVAKPSPCAPDVAYMRTAYGPARFRSLVNSAAQKVPPWNKSPTGLGPIFACSASAWAR